jgi:ribosomal peptide maturation radical SAM protein 1
MQELVSLKSLGAVSPGLLWSRDRDLPSRTFSRVALVSMPWGSIRKPALAVPILKGCAQRAGFPTTVYSLTIPFAEMLGIDQYEALSDRPLFPEWFFSQQVLGPGGSGEIANGWEQLKSNPAASKFREGLLLGVGGSESLLNKIALEYVPQFLADCVRKIPWGMFGAIGFTATFAQTFASVALAKRIKDLHPNIHVIFGGANVEGEMGVEFLNAFPWVDHVVHGEGEVVFPELLTSLAEGNKRKVVSVSSRAGETVLRGDADHPPFVDLNQAPVPDYSDFVATLRQSALSGSVALQLSFESSRGCWWGQKHHCTFCGLNMNGMSFRKKEPQRVLDEILELTSSNNCLNLAATDNILPLEYLQKLMPRLAEADLDLNLFYETKANLTRAQLELLANAGVRRIQPGIESFTTKLLSHMQKGITAIQNIQFIRWCRELSITANYNLLCGFPGESPEDYASYPKLFRSLQHLEPPSYVIPVVYQRFSPYDFKREQYNLELEADAAYAFLYPQHRVSLDRIAYYFQERGGKVPDLSYVSPVFSGVRQWQATWKDVMFFYSKGPGYIILHDNRRLSEDAPQDNSNLTRHSTIPEPGASIYLFCDQHRSLSAICKMVNEKFARRYSAKLVERLLEKLVGRQFMFEEGGKFLALAVRTTAREASRLS